MPKQIAYDGKFLRLPDFEPATIIYILPFRILPHHNHIDLRGAFSGEE